jgi:hypothetical protein
MTKGHTVHIFELRNGMLITHQGEVAKVINVKRKRLIVQHESGKQYDTWPSYCTPAPEGATFDLKVDEASGVTLGTVVKFKDTTSRPGPYVCVAMSAGPTYRLAKLGGDGGNYVYNVSPTAIQVMSMAEVKAYLVYLLA